MSAPKESTQNSNVLASALIPKDVLQRVSTFLSPRDAVQMASTCKSWRRQLCLSRLEPTLLFKTIKRYGPYSTGDDRIRGLLLPITSTCPRHVHTATLRFSYVDQGWGNRKGVVWLVAHDASSTAQVPLRVSRHLDLRGRIVAKSPIAEHRSTDLSFSFQPQSNEIYYLWYKVGGGGGHELILRNVVMDVLLFDDEDRNYFQNHRVLTKYGLTSSGSLLVDRTPKHTPNESDSSPDSFMRGLLHGTIRTFQEVPTEEQDKLTHLASFLASVGISTSPDSLDRLNEILQAQRELSQITKIEQEFATVLKSLEPDSEGDDDSDSDDDSDEEQD